MYFPQEMKISSQHIRTYWVISIFHSFPWIYILFGIWSSGSVTSGQLVRAWGVSPLAKMVARRDSYIGHAKNPFSSPMVPDWRWDQGKEGTCTIEVKMAAGGGTRQKMLLSLAWDKKGLVGRCTHPQHAKVWEVDWSFLRKHWGVSHTLANIAPGEQRNSVHCSWLAGLWLALRRWNHLFFPWPMWP